MIAQMRKANDNVTFFVLSKRIYHILRNINRFEINRFLVKFFVDQSGEFHTKSEHANFNPAFSKNLVRLDNSVQNRVAEIVIRTHKSKIRIMQLRVKTVDSIIKI